MADAPFKGIGEWRAQARRTEQPNSGWDVLKGDGTQEPAREAQEPPPGRDDQKPG